MTDKPAQISLDDQATTVEFALADALAAGPKYRADCLRAAAATLRELKEAPACSICGQWKTSRHA